MESVQQCFHDLDTVIDQVHALFDRWLADDAFSPTLGEDTVYRLRLAVHEWIANLVQHAQFNEPLPHIVFDVWPNGRRIRCVIEDNSDGFDFDLQLATRHDQLERLPERGMGLLMLHACAEELSYTETDDGRRRLEFYVSANQDPWLNIPF